MGQLYLLMAMMDDEIAIVPVPYEEIFREASESSGVPLDLLVSWCYLESRFDPRAGEGTDWIGLMQLSEEAWRDFGSGPWKRALDPGLAIETGAKYLAWLQGLMAWNAHIAEDDWQWGIAAYNWGPRKVLTKVFSKGGGKWERVPEHVRFRASLALGGILLPCHPDEIEDVLSLESAQDEWRWVKECLAQKEM